MSLVLERGLVLLESKSKSKSLFLNILKVFQEANALSGALYTILPNCVLYGIGITNQGTITAAMEIVVDINDINTVSSILPVGTNVQFTNFNLNVPLSEGNRLRVKICIFLSRAILICPWIIHHYYNKVTKG